MAGTSVDLTAHEKAVVLISGGPDAAVLAFWAHTKFELRALFVDYGQDARNEELRGARMVTEALGIPLEVINASGMRQSFVGFSDVHALMRECGGGGNHPCNDLMLVHGIAATWVILSKIPAMLIGVHADDVERLPMFGEYASLFEQAVRVLNPTKQFRMIAPLLSKTKAEVIKLGAELGAPLEKTWSCFYSQVRQCGTCENCLRRREAFSRAGVKDLTSYVA